MSGLPPDAPDSGARAALDVDDGVVLRGGRVERVAPRARRWGTALALCLLGGPLGAHSFYAGRTGAGLLQLVTFGGCGLWVLVDVSLLLRGTYTDGWGRPLARGRPGRGG